MDKHSDSNCEPIPCDDEQKISSSRSNSLQRILIEHETPSERAFLQQLSQMALDEAVCFIYFNVLHFFYLFHILCLYIKPIIIFNIFNTKNIEKIIEFYDGNR